MFLKGAKAMLPITTGVVPFGLVMGTVAAGAGMSLIQSFGMNFLIFAGASQLAAVDLMSTKASLWVVVATGLIINLRMILYSAALSDLVKAAPLTIKALVGYTVTDQTYSVLVAGQSEINSTKDRINFYLGASFCMVLAWQAAVLLGFFFGNFAPKSLSLEFAVPLSFICLVLPTLKNKNYFVVGLVSAILSIFLKPLPFNLGLLLSALVAISVGAYLSKRAKV